MIPLHDYDTNTNINNSLYTLLLLSLLLLLLLLLLILSAYYCHSGEDELSLRSVGVLPVSQHYIPLYLSYIYLSIHLSYDR